jgi:hypothetical protein
LRLLADGYGALDLDEANECPASRREPMPELQVAIPASLMAMLDTD